MELKDCRRRIDEINSEMERLFLERMEISLDVAAYKQEHHLPTFDPAREREILRRAREKAPAGLAPYVSHLFQQLMEMGRSYQNRSVPRVETLTGQIRAALENTPTLVPTDAVVACQGVEGAYSQIAVNRLFQYPEIVYYPQFEDVFRAVGAGKCRYGVLPIENSSYGSVNEVYDLMKQYRFPIVRGLKLRISHNLLARRGTALGDIREIYSHGQAIGQCRAFLAAHPGIRVTPCANTAVAAKMVSESDRRDVAAISSRECAALYRLDILSDAISDSDHNYTRFICISKEMEIYPGASRISMMAEMPHRPGSLNALLSKFAMLGLNLTKIESRPILGREFEFKFYFDLEASVYSEEVLALLSELAAGPEPFEFLGSYTEL